MVLEEFVVTRNLRRPLEYLLGLKMIVLSVWLLQSPQFLFVMVGYGIDLLVVTAISVGVFIRKKSRKSALILAGVLITVLGSVIQQIPIRLYDLLDQNDIYHFIAMLSFFCFYKSVSLPSNPERTK